MRALLTLVLLFGLGVIPAEAAFNLTQSFREQVLVAPPGGLLLAPTVLEVPMTGLLRNPVQVAVTSVSTGQLVASLYQSNTQSEPIKFQVASQSGKIEYSLFDANYTTASDFYLLNDTETVTTLRVVSETPITSSALDLRLSNNVALPNSIKISALNDAGMLYVVVGNQRMTSERVNFLETVAREWVIELTHSQPLRLAEVSFLQTPVEQTRTESVRFLAQPGENYYIYFNPDTYVSLPSIETPNLVDNKGVISVTPGLVMANSYFRESDSDSDGLIDRFDNCVNVPNQDQIDINQNGRGDVCDDWDRDGLANNQDNCPDITNRTQDDVDSDGIGDACDTEESRFTERHAWVAWVGLAVAAGTILSMFLFIKRKEEEFEKVTEGE